MQNQFPKDAVNLAKEDAIILALKAVKMRADSPVEILALVHAGIIVMEPAQCQMLVLLENNPKKVTLANVNVINRKTIQ
ncbi:MAG: hypothetical protein IJP74_11480 [Prevotella sp.]|nr:hypothetical protein [Prevotella sp.]